MSVLKRILSSIGIGATKVDTQLENDKLRPGDQLRGKVQLWGGSVEQHIESIQICVLTKYILEYRGTKTKRESIIKNYQLTEKVAIGPGESRDYSFTFTLPLETPITIQDSEIWVHTVLNTKLAFDPEDKNYIEVLPTELLDNFLHSLKDLGFKLKYAGNESRYCHLSENLPFVQEFEFSPAKGEFKKRMDRLECIFVPNSLDQFDVVMGVDLRVGGIGYLLSQTLNMQESRIRFSIDSGQVGDLTSITKNTIEKFF